MRNVLLGTSALALATAYTSDASAAEFDMNVGGYFEVQYGYAVTDTVNFVATNGDRGGMNDPVDESAADNRGFDVKRDNEIHFMPSITVDNGIEFGAHVELEGASDDNQIDNAFIWAEGSFGRVLLGSENSAGYLMHYAAPTDGLLDANDGDITDWIVHGDPNLPMDNGIGIHGDMTTYLENAGDNTERITYFTPRVYGLQFGVSYARDGEEHSNSQVPLQNGTRGNVVDVGLNYVSNIGGIDIATSVRYGTAFVDEHIEDPADPVSFRYDHNPTVWSAGLNLGWRNLTIGGSFGERNENGARHGMIYGTDISIESADRDGQAYDGGISYAQGPLTYSFTYFHGETAAIQQEGFSPGVDPRRKETLDNYVIGVKYALAKGIDFHGFAAYSVYERDSITNEMSDESDGFVFGTGMVIDY